MGILTRRGLLASFTAISLVGCQSGERAQLRYRVIASFDVDGRPFEASTVMEIHYARVTNSLTGMGGSTRLYGEALVVDIPGKGSLFILPIRREPGSSLSRIWEVAILRTLKIENSIGGLSNDDFERLRSAKGRFRYRMRPPDQLPAIVAFRDESDPKTIFELTPRDIGQVFPGVDFRGLEIETTDSPVTKKLVARLPWLNTSPRMPLFERDPPGRRRPISERPIGFLITQSHFFGNASR
ncbi:hypothetical protein MRBLMR1_004550 [Neorhizobium sp. LMR1-1-1.1]